MAGSPSGRLRAVSSPSSELEFAAAVDVVGLLHHALHLLRTGHMQRSLAAARQAYHREPASERTVVMLAAALIRTRAGDEARALLLDHIGRTGLTCALGFVLIQAHAQVGDDAAADGLIDQVLELEDPRGMDEWTSRIVRAIGGPWGEIEAYLQEAIRTGSWDARLRQARRALAAGDQGRIAESYGRVFAALGASDESTRGAVMALALRDLLGIGLPAIAALAAPHFDLTRHGPLAGILLLRAVGHTAGGAALLRAIDGLHRPEFALHTAHHARRMSVYLDGWTAEPALGADSLLLVVHDQPMWWEPLRRPMWLRGQGAAGHSASSALVNRTAETVAILPPACCGAGEPHQINTLGALLAETCRAWLGRPCLLLTPVQDQLRIAQVTQPWEPEEVGAVAAGDYGACAVVLHGKVAVMESGWSIELAARGTNFARRAASAQVAIGDYDDLCVKACEVLCEALGVPAPAFVNPLLPASGCAASALHGLHRCLERRLVDDGHVAPAPGQDPFVYLLHTYSWPAGDLLLAAMTALSPPRIRQRHLAALIGRLIDAPTGDQRALRPLVGPLLGHSGTPAPELRGNALYDAWLARLTEDPDEMIIIGEESIRS